MLISVSLRDKYFTSEEEQHVLGTSEKESVVSVKGYLLFWVDRGKVPLIYPMSFQAPNIKEHAGIGHVGLENLAENAHLVMLTALSVLIDM